MHKQTYIKINRAYFDSPFWNENRPRTKAEAYIDLFQMATVSVNKYTTPDFRTTINLTRGEGVWSIRFLAKRWKWSRGKVESFFKILKVRKKARQELRQGIMVTFITEYSVSQGSDIYKKDTKQDGVKTGSRRGQDKYKNVKNANNDKNVSTKEIDKENFLELWNKYPNKDGKTQAYKHFNSSVKTKEDWLAINTALTNYLKSERVNNGYVKNGSTWFNNWRDWVDYVEPQKTSQKFIPISEQIKIEREKERVNS